MLAAPADARSPGRTQQFPRGRAAAERSEGTHPGESITMGKGAAKAKKTRTGAAVASERAKSGPAR